MTKRQVKDDVAAIIEDEVAAIEADRDAPITDLSKISRGHARSKTLQVRLNPDEFAELERLAASRSLPTSTVAREAIIRLIRPEVARTAAASRLVDEFARYVATIGAVNDVAFPAGPRLAARRSSPTPRGFATLPDDDEPTPPESHPQGLGSGATWNIPAGVSEKIVNAMDEMPDVRGLPELIQFDDADLTYEVFTDPQGKFQFRVNGPLRPSIAYSTEGFLSKAAAERAVAALRNTVQEIRASAAALLKGTHFFDSRSLFKKFIDATAKLGVTASPELIEFDDADLTYQVFTNPQGKFQFRVNGPAPECIAVGHKVFESKPAAVRAAAALRKTVQEIRASAALDRDR